MPIRLAQYFEGMEPEHWLCGNHRIRDVAYMAQHSRPVDLGSPRCLVRDQVHPRNLARLTAISVFRESVRRRCPHNRVYQLSYVYNTVCSRRLLFARCLCFLSRLS